ncbi:MAG: hypothetical protein GY820_21630 [Gammaproteobacteria bacterium]|nr:hypothetical protein [Gammaproteobacteria bacterium]
MDAYVEYGVHCWDMAASGLIVTEAGGQFTDPAGQSSCYSHRVKMCGARVRIAAYREVEYLKPFIQVAPSI